MGVGGFWGDYTVFRVNRGGIREEYKWGIEENWLPINCQFGGGGWDHKEITESSGGISDKKMTDSLSSVLDDYCLQFLCYFQQFLAVFRVFLF